MEDRWRGPQDPDAQDSESSRKKHRGTDFLSQYLARRRQEQVSQPEEDDDESDEKPKKFRRFFKRLFGNIVEQPETVANSETRRSRFETFLAGAFLERATDSSPRSESTQEQNTIPSEATEAPTAEPLEYQAASQETGEPNRGQVAPRENLQPGSQPELTGQTPENKVDSPPEIPDRTIFERTPQSPVEQEVIIERGGNVALPIVLVGAEYLARKKADRKLDAKFASKTEELNKDFKKERINSEQLEQLVRQNREQLDALKRERNIGLPEQESRPVSNERVIPRIESIPKLEATPPIPEVKRTNATPEQAQKPETYKIMEQVAEAAEHDVPVERVFERSHEVKDDRTTPIGASSIGTIMATKVAGQNTSYDTSHQTAVQHDTSGLPVISDARHARLYQQAVKSGFWAAVIIIILGIIAYLVQ